VSLSEEFAGLTRLAAMICDMPMAGVVFVDSEHLWLRSRIGLTPDVAPREGSFCEHAIWVEKVFIVPDALEDERFSGLAGVMGEPHVRSYAGVPILSYRGNPIGVLCVMDSR